MLKSTKSWCSPGIGSDAVIPGLLDMALLYALRACYQESDMEIGWGPVLNGTAISSVLCSVHSDPGRKWTVESMGSVAGLSRAAFARRFTALVGRPPLSYLTATRLGTAARLLRESDESLGTVAQKVGYTAESAFVTAFKREFGAAPGAYRRRYRTPDSPAGEVN